MVRLWLALAAPYMRTAANLRMNVVDNSKWEWLPPQVNVSSEHDLDLDEWNVGDEPFPLPQHFTPPEDMVNEEQEGILVSLATALSDNQLEPVPGPAIAESFVPQPDARPLYAALSLHPPNLEPTELLVEQFTDWLQSLDSVCHAFYLLTDAGFGIDMEARDADGEVLSEEELEELERSQASARDAAAASREALQSDDESTSSAPGETAIDSSAEDASLKELSSPMVQGHLMLVRASSIEEMHDKLDGDPIGQLGGYSETLVYRWHRSDEPELNIPISYGCAFTIVGRDRPNSESIRSATRDAHRDWLYKSSRVLLGGPLEASEGGGNVGSLLFVRGESLEEVRGWAATDPYVEAGLFDDHIVSPAPEYFLSDMADLQLWSYN